jgi:hypothetical protein
MQLACKSASHSALPHTSLPMLVNQILCGARTMQQQIQHTSFDCALITHWPMEYTQLLGQLSLIQRFGSRVETISTAKDRPAIATPLIELSQTFK